MPKQLLHRGRDFHLVPMTDSSGIPPEDAAVAYYWRLGHPEVGHKDDGVILDQEPSAYLTWGKQDDTAVGNDPGAEGYVMIGFEFTEAFLRRLVASLDSWGPEVPKPERHWVESGPFSWRDLNVLAKTAVTARDDAYGKPQ